jgi:two-component system, chemotaxis family, protein-glutamate methylesterase/glutaminase
VGLRVLVVDDTALFRRLVSDAVASIPGMEVVGTAANGKACLHKLVDLQPDLVTLDIEMPEMDGIQVLDAIRARGLQTGVIVVSALTLKGGRLTMQALERGAFDFVTKPSDGPADGNREILRAALGPRLSAFARRLEIRTALGGARPGAGETPAAAPAPSAVPAVRPSPAAALAQSDVRPSGRLDVVAIGVSTGGPAALARVIPALPADLGVPVLVVQHMPPIFTQSLAESLAGRSAVRVREAVHGERIGPNTVYIAPGGRHMAVAPDADRSMTIQITDDPPEHNCRPAVDYMFRSVAQHYPGRALAVVLTGMGSDGTLGLRILKKRGAFTMAQDEASSVVYGMPKAAADAGVVDQVAALDAIPARIVSLVKGRRP